MSHSCSRTSTRGEVAVLINYYYIVLMSKRDSTSIGIVVVFGKTAEFLKTEEDEKGIGNYANSRGYRYYFEINERATNSNDFSFGYQHLFCVYSAGLSQMVHNW